MPFNLGKLIKITSNHIVGHWFRLTLEDVANKTLHRGLAAYETKIFGIFNSLNAARDVFELFVKQNLLSVGTNESQIVTANLLIIK